MHHFFYKGGVLVWPVDIQPLSGGFKLVTLRRGLRRPEVTGIDTIEVPEVRAFCYEWHSWAWQLENISESKKKDWKPALRMFVDSEGEAVVKVVCSRHSWWQIERSILLKFCDLLKIEVTSTDELFDLCFTMSKSCLRCSNWEALAYCLRRFARMSEGDGISDVFLEVDEAAEVCEPTDIAAIKERKVVVENHIDEKKLFKLAYHRKVGEIQKANKEAPPAKPNVGKLPPHIDQKEAKRFTPEDASIWLATRGEWCGHCKPYQRVCCLFCKVWF